jgi:hypothetical protein
MNRYRNIALLLCAALLPGCGDSAVQDITGPVPSASILFFNFGVGAPDVNFFAGDTKLTAISSSSGAESPLGTGYGEVAAGGSYTAIAPGAYTLSGRISDTLTDHELPISSLSTTIEDGRAYSYYLSGAYDAAAKSVDAFIVEDPIPATIDYSVAVVRFVNAIANAGPMTLYATSTDEATAGTALAVGDAVAYESAGTFTSLPPGVYDLATRIAGASTDALTRAAVSFQAGRVYTISAIGDITVTDPDAAGAPFLDNTANR